MRVLITGIPGDSQYFSDFKDRAGFLARVVEAQGHKVRNTTTSSRRRLRGVSKWIADGKFDAIIFENSMEKRPDIPMAIISGLVKERNIPVLFLRPDFFDDGVISSEGNSKRRMLIKDFVGLLQEVGCKIRFEYYNCHTETEEFHGSVNNKVKEMISGFFREACIGKERSVLSGREREV